MGKIMEALKRGVRAIELLKEVEKRRNVFPSPCFSCGKLPEPHGPGHATDCRFDALLKEESDD